MILFPSQLYNQAASKDLAQGQAIDFDESLYDLQKLVDAKAKAIALKKAKKAGGVSAPPAQSSFPGGMPGMGGGGVAVHSRNKANAIKLLEFLVSDEAQMLYGKINYEYPVNPATPLAPELKIWGDFKKDSLPISRLAELAPKAQMIIDRVGW